jgi:predicted 3-demethylubiquinone-9 3-methyltransferase (glyoxalase superfamily)
MQSIKPFIWFQGTAEAAMHFYVETFPQSNIVHIERYIGGMGIPGEDELKGKVLTGIFSIKGQEFQCLDGGPQFPEGGNISFVAEFETQNELDTVWGKLLDGGTPMQCGWITDKFGVTWQIIPSVMGQLMGDPHATQEQKQAVMQAMMPMVKLEIAPLQAAFDHANTI